MAEEKPDTTSEEEATGTTETASTTEAPEPKASAPVAETPAAETPEAEKPKAPKPAAKKTPAAKKAPAGNAKPAAKAKPAEATAPVARVQVSAHAKYVRTSARKARLVCDHIRGKSVEEAYAILAHTPRHVAEDWQKLLHSAVANAEHNHELVGEDLRIASVHADEGPTLKRFRPRAMGRASSIRKRTSHLSITLTPKEQ
jgi:ribosomal protein L22